MSQTVCELLDVIFSNLPFAMSTCNKRITGNLISSMKREMDGLVRALKEKVCIGPAYTSR